MAKPLDARDRLTITRDRSNTDSTIDNGATWRQLRFLGKVIRATPAPPLQRALDRGLDFLLDAQYANGGWPQFYPKPVGYQRHVTFNDDPMVSVLALLRDVARGDPALGPVDEVRRARARQAVQRGIRCILDCQVRVDGRRTVWCAQHDYRSLAPTAARTYELPSLSGGESVGIVRFLMAIEEPDAEVTEAIERAVEWFGRVKLTGARLESPSG